MYISLIIQHPDIEDIPAYKTLHELQPSDGSITVEVVVDASPEEIGIDSCNYWFLNGVGDISQRVSDYFNKPNKPVPGIYCTSESAKSRYFHDKYPGKTLITLITISGDYKWFEEWKDERPMCRSEGYVKAKDEVVNQLLDALYDRFPIVKKKEAFHYSSSPLTNEYYINSWKGSIYGIKGVPEKFNHWEDFRVQTPFSRLFIGGQDLFSHGVVGALFGGFFCACTVDPLLYLNLIKVASTSVYE